MAYTGRFAPSPTGPLHFGSLITAVASYCDAKASAGQWLVRIEDTDIPRIYPGSEDHILRSIDAFQFEPDAEIIFQKDRLEIYESVIEQLHQQGWVYACRCTRKMLGSNHIYAGTCRATRHLIQQGHTRIGYLCSNHSISDAEDRLRGYYDALRENGLPCNDRLVAYGEPDESGGEQAMTELLGRGRNFTAVASYNDSMAAGAMGVLNDNGIEVPAEISLIGFDDVLVSRYVRPRLTTVRYPIVTMATQAAELALALAEKRQPPDITHLFSPTLVRRHSVVQPAETSNE